MRPCTVTKATATTAWGRVPAGLYQGHQPQAGWLSIKPGVDMSVYWGLLLGLLSSGGHRVPVLQTVAPPRGLTEGAIKIKEPLSGEF